MGRSSHEQKVPAAAIVLPCRDVDVTAAFFTGTLGFRIDAVFPADDPAVVEISGQGLHIRLQRGEEGSPGVLRLVHDPSDAAEPREVTAPNGTRIQFVPPTAPLRVPPLKASFVLNRSGADSAWHTGRAGMLYRDLIPGRQGGRFIASHIRIPDGGPVPDYVHFHTVRFQMIFCVAGWVRVVYEDQGPPFVMEAGDCVLQPPRIRHRVLECSPGLEVVEITCPAEHETRADHDLALPTPAVDPERDFDGQRFVRHAASDTPWTAWRCAGFEARDSGIAAATRGLASAHVVRPIKDAACTPTTAHGAEFLFLYVLRGGIRFRGDGTRDVPLAAGDSVVVPAGMAHALLLGSRDLELLEVCLPAGFMGEPR